ncbi:MAG: NAD(+) synthase, partial [Myxococcaceae bacterium]
MRLVKIGLASVNTTVGATHANVERALRFAEQMAAAGVTVALYPEQMVGGYPPEDLIQWDGFVEDQWRALEHFARATRHQATVHVLGVAVAHQGLRYGCAAVVAGGKIRGLVPKEKLPTYSIY